MKPQLIVEQKITAFVNKYAVYEADEGGKKGRMVALAQQKRIALKEKVSFYDSKEKTNLVFTFRAEKVLDVHGRYLVEDAAGNVVGAFKKEFKKSLLNSTWDVLDAYGNPSLIVNESSQALAVLRRFSGFIPVVGDLVSLVIAFLRYHFVFRTADGQEVGRYQKTTLFRDHYLLSMTDEAFTAQDWRVLAAQAVALDALQSR